MAFIPEMRSRDLSGTIAEVVSEARELRRLTQGELADRAGLSRQTVYNIEIKRPQVTLGTLAALAKGLDVVLTVVIMPGGEVEANTTVV